MFSYGDSPQAAKHMTPCSMMQMPMFEDNLGSSDSELDLVHRTLSGIAGKNTNAINQHDCIAETRMLMVLCVCDSSVRLPNRTGRVFGRAGGFGAGG